MNPADILKEIAEQVSVCQKCGLCNSRKHSVPGEGPFNAEIMLIGEGPGFYENEQGRPFVGQAGKFLDELLQSAGLKREEVFITNVVKCRPPGNRDPQPDELAACSEYLDRQIETINPRIIVTLGRFSMAKFMPFAKISDVHGQPRMAKGRPIVPMFHPAAALHQPSLRPSVVADFSHLPEFIQRARKQQAAALAAEAASKPGAEEESKAPDKNAPTQLSLF
jgi:DNA polymerase